MQARQYSREAIITALDGYLEIEYNFYDTNPIAEALEKLPSEQIEFVLDWVSRTANTSKEIAFRLATQAPNLLKDHDQETIETWLLQAMDSYDRDGLQAAISVMNDSERWLGRASSISGHLRLSESEAVLRHYLHGLSGRALEIKPLVQGLAYTDTEVIFLPEVITHFNDKELNFLLYKATLTHLWAQTRFGTFRCDFAAIAAKYPNPELALGCIQLLEGTRLEWRLQQELPGLIRVFDTLEPEKTQLPEKIRLQLQRRTADCKDSIALLAKLYGQVDPVPWCYQGCLRPDLACLTQNERIEREKTLFRIKISDFLQNEGVSLCCLQSRKLKVECDQDQHILGVELTLDGTTLRAPSELKQLMTSIWLDFGEVPPDYLVPAGPGEYDISQYQSRALNPENVWSGTYHEEGAFFYNEWDYRRQHYKKNWCVLRELEVAVGEMNFYRTTLKKYHGLLLSLRRTFEYLRGGDQLLRRQSEGEEVDLDAFVDAWPSFTRHEEMTDRLFIRRHKNERSVAALLMVDMSGSTRGWVNLAEREALILLSEVLQVLGDHYAIYGFSGWARKRCEVFRVKAFDETLDDVVKGRISGIEPKDYTRMGAPIRHLSQKLKEIDARIKLLITLSDGKPDDYDLEYRGAYSIEDTRMALLESRRNGIHPYCITIDTEGKDYLPHMYGAANYTVIDQVKYLPLKIVDIYRRFAG